MAVKFFDEQWYLANNPDVAEAVAGGSITAEQHFEFFGMQEGRSPSPLFDAQYYLAQNSDVAEAVEAGTINAYQHFEQHGHTEGRDASPYFNVSHYLVDNPDVADVVDDGAMSAYEHYQSFGIHEGRAPLASFDAELYLAANPDVAAAVENNPAAAAKHFMTYAPSDDRSLSAIIAIGAYLDANLDVKEAVEAGHTTGLAHLLTFGVKEGRDLGNGITTADFAQDPVYQEAFDSGNTDAALARMSEVAPFLPEFQAPEGFVLPADWPIPQEFVPAGDTKLELPEGWQPAEPTRLPDSFVQPFNAVVADGVVTFPDATGEIHVVNEDGQAGFAQNNILASAKVPLDGTATVQLVAGQVLVGLHSDIAQLNVEGEGTVLANGTAEADMIDASGWSAVNLTIDGKEGDDTITVADTQTALGGEGADTFVIAATAGTPSVITVDDYDFDQGDVIDLSEVENFNILTMEVRGAEHDGTNWLWGEGYNGDSLGIWLTGEVANVQITGARDETVKFALPDVGGFDGYNTMQLNITDGGVMRAGDESGEILRGGSGTQFLISGAEGDVLSGGAGSDAFIIQGDASRLNSMDRLLDFEIGTDALVGDDLILGGSFFDGGSLANLNAATIAASLTAENFDANGGAYFTVEAEGVTRTFVALNDDTAGFDANSDTLIEITGYSGDLAQLSVVGVPGLEDLPGSEPVQELLSA